MLQVCFTSCHALYELMLASLFLSFLVCICAQWLGLDKELKKLVVETTANQVTFWCLSVVLMFVMFL